MKISPERLPEAAIMRVNTRRNSSSNLVVDVLDVETLSDFEETVEKIAKRFDGKLLDTVVGPDGTATCFVRFARVVLLFDLVDMVGMLFVVGTPVHEELALRIAKFLEEEN